MGKMVKCTFSNGSYGVLDTGSIYEVNDEFDNLYRLKGVKGDWDKNRFVDVKDNPSLFPQANPLDAHYDFTYSLTKEDMQSGKIKIDPYFVASIWRTGERDPSGVIWHIFKTCARFGNKNDKVREIKAIYKSIKRLAELENVQLD